MPKARYLCLIASILYLASVTKVSSLKCYQCKSEKLVDGSWTNTNCFMNPRGPEECEPEAKSCVIYTAGKTKNEPYEFGRACMDRVIHTSCYLQTWLPEFLLEERCFPQVCGSDGCNFKHPPGDYDYER